MSYPVRPWRGSRRGDPFSALDAMQERMARAFGDAFGGVLGRTAWHPDLDVDEEQDGWTVTVRLAGVAPEEVSIDVADRELVIQSKDEVEDEVEAEQVGAGEPVGREAIDVSGRRPAGRRWSRFTYRVDIPSDVDLEKIDATMDHGLLTVHLPRTGPGRSRRIAVGQRGRDTQTGS